VRAAWAEFSSAATTKIHAHRILKATARAVHAGALRHSHTNGPGHWGRSPASVPDRHGLAGVSVLQSWPSVKRKAVDDLSGKSAMARWSHRGRRDRQDVVGTTPAFASRSPRHPRKLETMRVLVCGARVMPQPPGLADHLVGPEGRRRDGEARCLSGLEVDDQLECGGLLHGQGGALMDTTLPRLRA
jgi:hypothetical protein